MSVHHPVFMPCYKRLAPWTFLIASLLMPVILGLSACSEKITNKDIAADNIKRVVFLGNSITYSGQYIADIEAYFRITQPELKLEWINVGLPSETVSGLSEEGHADGAFPRPDLHERLYRVLEQTQPDLVFANYGMNDGIYLPFDIGRFEQFKSGMIRLHEAVVETGAKIVHLTPPLYDETKGGKAGYDQVLHEYSQWLLDQRKENKWQVLDIYGPMKTYLEKKRSKDPLFYLASDGVHPGDEGHWIIAKELLVFLGENEVSKSIGIHDALKEYPASDQVIGMVRERQQLMWDAWLTASGHQRPGVREGLPMEMAREKAESLDSRIAISVRQGDRELP
jgi:lysophospholipase L1-like esterase